MSRRTELDRQITSQDTARQGVPGVKSSTDSDTQVQRKQKTNDKLAADSTNGLTMDRLVFPSYATNRTRTRPESDHSAVLSLCYLLCYILLPAALS